MKTLDCKGLNCPKPVLQTKAYLEEHTGEAFSVIVNNEASRENVLRFGRSQGCVVNVQTMADGSFEINFQPGDGTSAKGSFRAEDYDCVIPPESNLVYIISSDSMGRGSEELGWGLLQTYVSTIEQVNPLPSHIILYNAGVKLAATDNKGLEALQNLEKKGVEIWSCGTCLEFFHLEENRKVGTITNMYDIMNTMATAGKVVSPY
jgi:selenium metabolism protein YedF